MTACKQKALPLSLGLKQGRVENSLNRSWWFESLNRSRRREEADGVVLPEVPPPHVGGYKREVHGEKRFFIQFVMVAGLSLLTSVATVAETNVVATVAGAPVTIGKVRQTILRNGYNVFEADSARKALDESVQFELLAAAAKKIGMDQRADVAERIKQILVESYTAEKVDQPLQGIAPPEAELKAYYDSHPAEFSQPALARGQVLTIWIPEGKETEVLARAGEALNALKNGKAFEELTAQFSDDPSERVGRGAPTWFTEGKSNRRYPDRVIAALFASKVGEVSGPIKTPRAVYLVKLAEKRDSVVRPFNEAKPVLARAVLLARRQSALAELTSNLKKEFPVKVDEARLSDAVEKSSPGGGPPQGPVDVK